MTITFIGSATGSTGGTTDASFSITLPGGLQEDDIVLVVVGWGSNSDDSPGVNTSGYTEVAELYQIDSVSSNVSVNWKRMGAVPDTTVDCIAEGTANNDSIGVAYVVRGVDTTTVLDVALTNAGGSNSAIPDPPSITPVTSDAMLVVCGFGSCLSSSGDSSVTPPTGFTNQESIAGINVTYSGTMAVASKVWGGGAEDPTPWTDWTTSTSSSWIAVTLALRPISVLTLPTGALIITGSTPAIAPALTSGSITFTTGTPVPKIAIPVYPASGALTLTGTTPTPVTAVAVYPATDFMQITGGTPTISAGMAFAGNSPGITGSLIFENLIDFAGTTPPVSGELDFGEEFFFDVVSPLMEGTIDGAASFSVLTPNQTAAFEIELEQYGSFSGKSPVMEGSFDFGGEFSGIAPQMTGALSIELESYGSFHVKSPAMTGIIDISQSLSFGGYSPAMTGTFETELEQYGSFVGTTPAILGAIVFEDGEFSFAGLTPSMEGLIEFDVDNGISFALETPPSIGHINIGLLAAIGTPDSDISTTSDGIIRHRRVYDNG